MDLFNIKGLQSSNLRINKIDKTYPSQNNKKDQSYQYQPKEQFEYILQKELNKNESNYKNDQFQLQTLSGPLQLLNYQQAVIDYLR